MKRGSTAWIHNNSNCSLFNLKYRIILRWITPEYNAIGHTRMKIRNINHPHYFIQQVRP